MIHIIDQKPSIADQYLFELRHKDIQKDRARFRNNLKNMGMVLALEISRELEYQEVETPTSLGTKKCRRLFDPPVLISILRAGQPLLEGFQRIFPDSECGFIGAFRLEAEGDSAPSIMMRYQAVPDLTGRTAIVIDPMLATGKSMVRTIEVLLKAGVKDLRLACVVAAPEGVEYVKNELTHPYSLWIGSLDEKLNKEAYIVPGLGDAGDLAYGKKL